MGTRLLRIIACYDGVMNKASEQIDSDIASLGATLTAITHQLIVKIGEFDRCDGYVGMGFLTCAQYLNFRIGLSLGAAREKVRVAHALLELPQIDALFAAGELSYSKVRAMTRIATRETEEGLILMANDVSAGAFEKIVRLYRRVETSMSAAKREEARRFSVVTDETDGMCVISGRLLAEEGALLLKALEAAPMPKVEHGSRLADAIVFVAAAALGGDPAAPCAADRHQVIVHVDAPVLSDPCADGRANVEDTGVCAEVVRRLCCDASMITMAHDKDGNVVSTSRKTRVLSTPLRRKLKERDQHCRFPGCTCRTRQMHPGTTDRTTLSP